MCVCMGVHTVGKCNNECGVDPVIEVNCSKSRAIVNYISEATDNDFDPINRSNWVICNTMLPVSAKKRHVRRFNVTRKSK